ncbi:hypothetical protein ACWD1Z_36675 [Streptomyces sp. NPDC002784]
MRAGTVDMKAAHEVLGPYGVVQDPEMGILLVSTAKGNHGMLSAIFFLGALVCFVAAQARRE